MKPKATPVSEKTTMKKLNVTKERFEKSRYFQRKYGKLEYVSESGKYFKTSKGNILKFLNEDGNNADGNAANGNNADGNDVDRNEVKQEYLKEIEDALYILKLL